MTIDNELHARALKEFGYGYFSPANTDNVLVGIFKRIDEAEARVTELEEHTDTAIKCISDRNTIYEEAKDIEARLESIETIYRDNYGNATMMHLAMVGIFGEPEVTS